MVSERYVQAKRWLISWFMAIGRWHILIFIIGCGLFAIPDTLRAYLITFIYLWLFISLAVTYIIYYVWTRNWERLMDGDK